MLCTKWAVWHNWNNPSTINQAVHTANHSVALQTVVLTITGTFWFYCIAGSQHWWGVRVIHWTSVGASARSSSGLSILFIPTFQVWEYASVHTCYYSAWDAPKMNRHSGRYKQYDVHFYVAGLSKWLILGWMLLIITTLVTIYSMSSRNFFLQISPQKEAHAVLEWTFWCAVILM